MILLTQGEARGSFPPFLPLPSAPSLHFPRLIRSLHPSLLASNSCPELTHFISSSNGGNFWKFRARDRVGASRRFRHGRAAAMPTSVLSCTPSLLLTSPQRQSIHSICVRRRRHRQRPHSQSRTQRGRAEERACFYLAKLLS